MAGQGTVLCAKQKTQTIFTLNTQKPFQFNELSELFLPRQRTVPCPANSYYSFTFYGLLASELRTIVDVAIYNGNTQLSETLRYSAESYAAKTNGTNLELLTKALFAYSDSAKAYFTK